MRTALQRRTGWQPPKSRVASQPPKIIALVHRCEGLEEENRKRGSLPCEIRLIEGEWLLQDRVQVHEQPMEQCPFCKEKLT